MLSDLGEDAAWQLEVTRRDEELPGSGLLLFEPADESPGRRLVAAYGHPSTAALGVMDGQGSLAAKYNTWNSLTGRADVDRFYWGWKNFYDEDRPMATPEQVLELSPEIVFVSFQ